MGPADENAGISVCALIGIALWTGAIIDVDFMVSCKAQIIPQGAGCIVCIVELYSLHRLEEMALAAVSQFRFFYRRVYKLWLF